MDVKREIIKLEVVIKVERNDWSAMETPILKKEEDPDYDLIDFTTASYIRQNQNNNRHHPSIPVEFGKLTGPRIRSMSPSCCRDVKDNIQAISHQGLNFAKLGIDSLWRYCERFNLERNISSNPTKEELVSIVKSHFSSQQVDEEQVIVEFGQAVKRLSSS